MSTVVLSAPNVTMANEAIHVIVEKTFISYKKEGWNGMVSLLGVGRGIGWGLRPPKSAQLINRSFYTWPAYNEELQKTLDPNLLPVVY